MSSGWCRSLSVAFLRAAPAQGSSGQGAEVRSQAEATEGCLPRPAGLSPSPFWQSRAAVALALLGAGWPLLRWYAARLRDGSDEPFGLIALAAGLFFAPWSGGCSSLPQVRSLLVTLLLAAYGCAYPFSPPLVRALLWLVVLAAAVAPRPTAFAWLSLLGLSLPWVATLQFYLGYPLRCVTTFLAAGLLRLGGLAVQPEGAVLTWAGEQVLIDVPCSGIQMAWTMLTFSAIAANARGLAAAATLRLFRRAGMVVLVANTLRACALFCIEMQLWPVPASPAAHDVVGLVLFAVAGGIVLWGGETKSAGRERRST